MDFTEPNAETPLLFNASILERTQSPNYYSILKPHSPDRSDRSRSIGPHDSLEDDVLPETAVLGRNLGWNGAFILTISRVIGSGIFATPGAIVSSTGSIGLSLLLWVAGALISWCGLVVSLEYGCMLPRSGG